MSFNDPQQLVRWCFDVGSVNITIPSQPGVQCSTWPPTAQCKQPTGAVIDSSAAMPIAYSLIISLLKTDADIAAAFNTTRQLAANMSNLLVTSTFVADEQTNNFDEWPNNVQTVFSSLSWSSLIVTNQPRSTERYTQVSSTYDYSCALSVNGSIYCWGSTQWYIAWPRCSGNLCFIYGNLCAHPTSCNNNGSAVLTRPYSTFSAPALYEPYIDMCVTGAYACAISSNNSTQNSVICWMGLYGSGQRIVRWDDRLNGTQPANVVCNTRANMTVCPAPMIPDPNAFINEQFTSIRCSEFSVCGINMNGSILCSSLPVRYANATRDIIIHNKYDIPFVHVGQSNDNQLCGITLSGKVRCNSASTRVLGSVDGPDRLWTHTKALAPQHMYRVGGGTDLRPCSGGAYSDRLGATTSLCSGPCRRGYVGSVSASSNTSECNSPCSLGHWCPSGTDHEFDCLIGHFGGRVELTASSECALCDTPGVFCPAATVQPLLCPRGAFCPNATGYVSCPAGRYGDEFGLFDEKCSGECARGFLCTEFSVDARQQPCPTGQFNNRTGQGACTDCEPGTYATYNPLGTVQCTSCSAGTFAPSPGSSQCYPCAAGHYNLLSGASNCLFCGGVDGVECENGSVRVASSYHASIKLQRAESGVLLMSIFTQPCSDGYCVGTDSTKMDLSAIMMYNLSERTDTVYLALSNQCSEHRDQSSSSPLCSLCQSGYAPADIGSPYTGCVSCDGVSSLKLFLFIGVSWLLVIVYYIASNGRLGLIGSLLYFVQTIAIMVSSRSSLTAWFRTFGFTPISILPNECIAYMSPELQYAIPLFIPPIQVAQLLVLILIHYLIHRYINPAVYKLDERMMAYVMTPAQLIAYRREVRFPFAQWWMILIRYRIWPELTVSTFMRSLFIIFIASFTSVILTCVSWFSCSTDIRVGLSGTPGSVVLAFPAVSCSTTAYVAWSFVMAAHIIAWIIVIVLCMIWMFYHRRQLAALQRQTQLKQDINDMSTLLPLTAIALVPHTNTESEQNNSALTVPFLQQTGFGIYWPTALAGNEQNSLDEAVCDSGDVIPMESRRQYAFRSVYGALFDSFRQNAISWQIVILIRRLLLIIFSVFIIMPAAKYLTFIFLHMIICALHLYYNPYTTNTLNHVEQVVIVLHIIIAAILTAYPIPSSLAIQSSILTLTLAPIISFLLYHMVKPQLTTTEDFSRNENKSVDERLLLNASLLSHSDRLEPLNEPIELDEH
jgi:hypothetical protein